MNGLEFLICVVTILVASITIGPLRPDSEDEE